MSNLVEFYKGISTDHRGRSLDDLWAYSDDDLESYHDYIQWMFPTRQPSNFNPYAPTLAPEDIAAFRNEESLRARLRQSFFRILSFYGLELTHDRGGLSVKRAENWDERMDNWLTPADHNHLRITRILSCLNTLSLRREARAFYACLLDLYGTPQGKAAISARTFDFWRNAANDDQMHGHA